MWHDGCCLSLATYRQDGMVDIQPKQCQETGCKYAASFGDRREKKIRFCARHKLLGMISIQEMVGDLKSKLLWERGGVSV